MERTSWAYFLSVAFPRPVGDNQHGFAIGTAVGIA
jgi:hypothetical protein